MMAKPTPGKWIAVGSWIEHESDDVADIATFDPRDLGQKFPRSQEEINANATLCAAAPQMYRALIRVLPIIESLHINCGALGPTGHRLDIAESMILSALTKAEGA